MKLEICKEPVDEHIVYKLTISRLDMAHTKFDKFDLELMKECSVESENATISDKLLVLEMIARRVEEHSA